MLDQNFEPLHTRIFLYILLTLFLTHTQWTPLQAQGKAGSQSLLQPDDISGLLCFWDFQEHSGADRMSWGKYRYALKEMNGPIRRVEDGIFGKYCVDIEWGQWFRIERKDAPGMDIHGTKQQLTMVAWVKRESDRVWQYIAGMWDEGLEKYRGKASGEGPDAPDRQYAMFINGYWQTHQTDYTRTRAENQVHGYVSPYGGATPDHPFAFDYATGGTKLEKGRWYMIAYTFDGSIIKVFVNGELDSNENCNPFPYDGPIHDGGEDGADFTVALRRVPTFPSYPEGKPDNEAGFDGHLGGLAIYDRALREEEINKLYQVSMSGKTP